MMAVETLSTPEALAAVASEWDELERATPEATGFQSVALCHAWLAATAQSARRAQPRIVAVRDAGRLVLVWPLAVRHMVGVRVVGWLGEPLVQYGDVLALPGAQRDAWIAAAWGVIARWKDVDVVNLHNVRNDAVLAQGGFLPKLVVSHRAVAPFVDLRSVSLDSRRRDKTLLRRMRWLASQGKVSLDVPDVAADRRALAEEALALKEKWLADKGLISAGLGHPALRPCLVALAESGTLIVSRLRVDDDTAALELGLQQHGVYRSLLGTFDPRYAAGAPGHVLTRSLLERFTAAGARAYDFLAPADDYKQRWATGEVAIESRLMACTWRGRVALLALRRRQSAKAAYARIPRPLRGVVAVVARGSRPLPAAASHGR